MLTLSLEPLLAAELSGYDPPIAADDSHEAASHLALGALLVLAVAIVAVGVFVRIMFSAMGALVGAAGLMVRLVAAMVAIIAVLVVLGVAGKTPGGEGPTPTPARTHPPASHLVAPGTLAN